MRLLKLRSAIGLALTTIREHKMRAFLTILGVIIGTGTIIGVGSILAGLDGAITGILNSFGGDTIIVFKFKIGPGRGSLSDEERQRKPLTWDNARAIAERCPSVQATSPYLFPPRVFSGPQLSRVKYKGNDMYQIDMGGTEEGYAAGGTNGSMIYGRFFSDTENRRRLPVVVIGEDVYKALFASGDPTGKTVDVDGRALTVVGVMSRPSASFPGQQDSRVLLPYHTMQKLYPNAKENMIIVVAYPGKLAQAEDEVTAVLRQERRVAPNKPDNFSLTTSKQMVDDFRRITAVTTIVMVVLSSIGLLVGGIGVMNIMLVSVTERTREIGVRKAIGARRVDIVTQFLTEAVVLTGLGGCIGLLLGWMISFLAHFAFPSLPTMVPLWAALMGILVSVGIGLFFGIWPANKAARLDPVEALRYE